MRNDETTTSWTAKKRRSTESGRRGIATSRRFQRPCQRQDCLSRQRLAEVIAFSIILSPSPRAIEPIGILITDEGGLTSVAARTSGFNRCSLFTGGEGGEAAHYRQSSCRLDRMPTVGAPDDERPRFAGPRTTTTEARLRAEGNQLAPS